MCTAILAFSLAASCVSSKEPVKRLQPASESVGLPTCGTTWPGNPLIPVIDGRVAEVRDSVLRIKTPSGCPRLWREPSSDDDRRPLSFHIDLGRQYKGKAVVESWDGRYALCRITGVIEGQAIEVGDSAATAL